jgi:hypothetical protein
MPHELLINSIIGLVVNSTDGWSSGSLAGARLCRANRCNWTSTWKEIAHLIPAGNVFNSFFTGSLLFVLSIVLDPTCSHV